MTARTLAASILLLIAAHGSALRAETRAPPAVQRAGVDDRIGASLPLETHFRSSDDRDVRLGSALGNGEPTLLVLAYNRCEMLCSLVLGALADLVRELRAAPGPRFSVVTLSIDPTETVHEAARMRTVLLERAGLGGPWPEWQFLLGEQANIEAVASSVGFRYAWDPASRQYAHPAVIFAISADGKLLAYFQGLDPDPARVRSALSGSSAARGVGEMILSCFRYDPATSKYGPTIAVLLRASAAGLSLSMLGLVAWLFRRERRREVS